MSSHAIWKTRPLFVSSTFRDMHAERGHLWDVVFPALEERLRARFHLLDPIDLRLGVATEAAGDEAERELLILKLCLGEIERSRPFLIGLLGDRYGWVPPGERMDAAAREAGFTRDLSGRSVTAIEIEFGVLASPGQQRRSRFYLRAPLPYDAMDAETAAEFSEAHASDREAAARRQRLEELKTFLRNELPPDRVRTYQPAWDAAARRVTSLDEWGRQVIEDLWEDIEAEIGAVAPPATWQEQERLLVEQFVATACSRFVGRETLLSRLMALAMDTAAERDARGICLTGPPGSGKSSVFAEICRRLRDRDVLVLAHAAGISPRSSDVDAILRRWCFELAAAAAIPDPSPEAKSRDDLRDAFYSLLQRVASGRRVVCMIDALNQLERSPSARHTTWLPDGWPVNASLIVTAIKGSESEGLMQRRRWIAAVDLDPLTGAEAEAIAATVSARRHASVRPELVQALTELTAPAGAPASGNPLWLELALEEVLLLDEDDFRRAQKEYHGRAENRLHALRMDVALGLPPTVDGLYAYLLEHMENVHGQALAGEFVCLISQGRTGWRESDLRVLLPIRTGEPWDELRVAALRRGFRAHLVQRGVQGQWDFHHTQMREAVASRYFVDAGIERGLHSASANHLEGLPASDPIRQTELMHHLLRSGDMTRAAKHYASDLDEASLAGATAALAVEILERGAEDSSAAGNYCRALLEAEGVTDLERGALAARYTFDVGDALAHSASLELKFLIQKAGGDILSRLVRQDAGNTVWQRDLSVSHDRVGNVLQAQGNLAGALKAYGKAMEISERLVRQDAGNTGWQWDLSVGHGHIGDVLREQGNLSGALEAYGKGLEISERLVRQDARNTGGQRSLSASYSGLGLLLQAQGNLSGALEAYGKALEITERLVRNDAGSTDSQRDLSVSHNHIGDVLREQGNLSGALEAYGKGLEIRERLMRLDAGNTDWLLDLSVSYDRVGLVLQAQGNLAGALKAYGKALELSERLVLKDDVKTNSQRHLSAIHDRIGDVLQAQGNLAGALEAYGKGLAIRERLVRQNAANTGWQRDLSVSHNRMGGVLQAQENSTGALEAYGRALEIRERLARKASGNRMVLRDLVRSHFILYRVYASGGEKARAAVHQRNCSLVLQRMQRLGMSLDPFDVAILAELEEMGIQPAPE